MKGDSFVMDLGYNVSQAHHKKIQKMDLKNVTRRNKKRSLFFRFFR